MSESKTFLHAPAWVKIGAIISLAIVTFVCVWIVTVFVEEQDKQDLILVALAVAQISISGIVFILVFFFTEREYSTDRLREMSETFLTESIPESLNHIDWSLFSSQPKLPIPVEKNISHIFGKTYYFSAQDWQASMWVGVNVNKLFLIYLVENFENKLTEEDLRRIFHGTFSGAENGGYTITIEKTRLREKSYFSIWATVVDENPQMLSDPHRRLFRANDIAMGTLSFLYTANRNNVSLSYDPSPRPL